MCGIGGFIRTSKGYVSNTERTLRDLSYFNQLRGVDALGAFKVSYAQDKHEVVKDIGSPYRLLNTDGPFKPFFANPGDARYFVMHNRHATRGQNTPANAHPFVVRKKNDQGSITMVHNGTITHNSLQKEFEARTDSQSIAKMIASGMSLTDMDACLWGSYALVWYDSEDKTLHFVRNTDRPFGFVMSTDTIWFGSEVYAVAAASERNNHPVKEILRLEPQEEWIWHADGKSFEKKKFPLKPRHSSVNFGAQSQQGKFYQNQMDMDADWAEWVAQGRVTDQVDVTGLGGPEDDVTEALSKESPKSSDRTGVVVPPFPVATQSIRNPVVGALLNQRRSRRYDRAGAPKYHNIPGPADGFAVGDWLCFSLTNYVATGRGSQVKLDGIAVAFTDKKPPNDLELLRHIQVKGMISLQIGAIDHSNCMWQGTVSHIAQAEVDGKKQYIFTVSEVKMHVSFPDPFRDEHLKLNPLKPVVIEGEFYEELTPEPEVVEPSKKASSEDTSQEARNCFDCRKRSTKWHEVTERKDSDDEEHVVWLTLCRNCFENCLADPSRLEHLFDTARYDAQNPGNVIPFKQIGFIHPAASAQQ